MARAKVSEESESAVREQKIEELQEELEAIRSNKLGFFYSGFLWGIFIGVLVMAFFVVALTLPFYGILPEYSLPAWLGTEKFFIAMFSIPLVSSLVWICWALIRVAVLKNRLKRLEAPAAA